MTWSACGLTFLLGGFVACTICLLYAIFVEPHWVRIVKKSMRFERLPSFWRGKTIVHISDLHIGRRVSREYLLACFAKISSLRPDLVLITGDLTDYHPGILDQFSQLLPYFPKGTLGTLAVPGNHDYGPKRDLPEIADALAEAAERQGVQILRNEALEIEGLVVAGLDDLQVGRADLSALQEIFSSSKPTIVLAHNPDLADVPGWGKFQGWILCGHTHGGQCKPPFLPPPVLPVKNRKYTSGTFVLRDGRTLYVNSGLGHLLRARFNARPEITVFTLESGSRPIENPET